MLFRILQNYFFLTFLLRNVGYKVTNGQIGSQFGAPALLITTIGRKSGLPRTNPLFYLEDGQNWIVVASNGGDDKHPAWWLNLQVQPQAQIQIKGRQYKVTAREVTNVERNRLWPQLLSMFAEYETYQQMTEREIPVIMLEPNDEHR